MNALMREAILKKCTSAAERARTEAAIRIAFEAGQKATRAEFHAAFRVLGLATLDDIPAEEG